LCVFAASQQWASATNARPLYFFFSVAIGLLRKCAEGRLSLSSKKKAIMPIVVSIRTQSNIKPSTERMTMILAASDWPNPVQLNRDLV
jgi:hypothetical protein